MRREGIEKEKDKEIMTKGRKKTRRKELNKGKRKEPVTKRNKNMMERKNRGGKKSCSSSVCSNQSPQEENDQRTKLGVTL